ncbi:fimbrial protein [Atlantibacter sp.]|uniref:fimbrial protein n=1 Tax=Atlantibacter sp. TaxID=1903473 RepID=UPI0028B0190C|nr:fimbrial protein [Atlantibacter sp.]
MNKLILMMTALLTVLMLNNAAAAEPGDCKTRNSDAQNLTVPVTVQLPLRTTTAPAGSVLYKKEASLAQLTGSHHNLTGACLEKIQKMLSGRIAASQQGSGVFATALPGLGLRITVIFDKPGQAKKEWVLPFNAPMANISNAVVSTDDIKLRLEAIKTGVIQSGTVNVRLPSLLALSDNSLVVNLAMTVLTPKAHCTIQVPNPQIDLPPIDSSVLEKNSSIAAHPVNVSLSCLNTQQASINVEGINDSQSASIFKNVSEDNPASGVGIEMLYNQSVMIPGHPLDISLPQQQNGFSLPLSVRYARTQQKVSTGKVKAQITLRINYL